MSLTLSPQSSRFIPVWERDKFWEVVHRDCPVGYMVVTAGRSDEPPRWEWSIHIHAGRLSNGLTGLSGTEIDRDAAMSVFRKAFERCMAQIGEEGWGLHLHHMARLAERAGTKPPSSG